MQKGSVVLASCSRKESKESIFTPKHTLLNDTLEISLADRRKTQDSNSRKGIDKVGRQNQEFAEFESMSSSCPCRAYSE